MDYSRQKDLLNQDAISRAAVTIIGCGAIGSTVAMALTKMGVNSFHIFDDDGVSDLNLPNQFFFTDQINAFKVDAVANTLERFNTDVLVTAENHRYVGQPLSEIAIVATDSMASRKIVWEYFKIQPQCHVLIEARMGAEEGQIYTISKLPVNNDIKYDDAQFYEERLYSDEDTKQAPCTAKAVIYNVFMIASLVCRAFKSIVTEEAFPREVIMGMAQMNKYSFMVRE